MKNWLKNEHDKSGRRLLKQVYALAYLFALKGFRPAAEGGRILMFHSIPRQDIDGFIRQMRFIRDNYEPLPFSEFIARLKTGTLNGRKTVTITFDDGFKDNIENATPVLKHFNLPAMFFVTTRLIDLSGKESLADFLTNAYPNVKRFNPSLSWEDLKGLLRDGFEIGSHTVSHRPLTKCNGRELNEEIKISKKMIEDKLGTAVKHFSFPFGTLKHAPPGLAALVEEAGYESSASGVRGWNRSADDLFLLRRDNIEPGWPVYMLKAVLAGAFDK